MTCEIQVETIENFHCTIEYILEASDSKVCCCVILGRLDPSKVSEGRAVLAASLASYGLPMEERIRNTVGAVEFDRGKKKILTLEKGC